MWFKNRCGFPLLSSRQIKYLNSGDKTKCTANESFKSSCVVLNIYNLTMWSKGFVIKTNEHLAWSAIRQFYEMRKNIDSMQHILIILQLLIRIGFHSPSSSIRTECVFFFSIHSLKCYFHFEYSFISPIHVVGHCIVLHASVLMPI